MSSKGFLSLLRVELDDQILVDVRENLVALGQVLERPLHVLVVDLDPLGKADLARNRQRRLDAQLLLGAIANGNLVARLQLIRRDVDDLLVDLDAAMAHELARFGARRREAHAVHDVVEPRLEHAKQVLARRSFDLRSLLVIVAELPLEHAVHAPKLLLLAQLHAVIGQALAPLPGTARRYFELALALERLEPALQEQVSAFATRKLAGWASISRHKFFRLDSPLLWRTTAVVRNRSDVFDLGDSEPDRVQRAHRRLAPGARALDADLEALDAVLFRGVAGLLGRDLSRERRALARAFEAAIAGRRPRENVPLPIRDADDRVVEGRVNMGHGVEDLPFDLLANLRSNWRCGCHLGRSSSKLLDAAARAFARARVRPRALAAQRQAAAVPNTSVTAEIHEALDVHRDLAAQIALDGELRDDVAQARDLRLRQILDLRGRVDGGRLADHQRSVAADAEDVRERNAHVLVGRNVDACYTCHSCYL